MRDVEVLVVGSGASALAVSTALIARGVRPFVVDAGLTSDSVPQTPSHSEKSGLVSLGTKTFFGSSFPFWQPASEPIEYQSSQHPRASYSPGGLTRVWGATVDFHHFNSAWINEAVPEEIDLNFVRSTLETTMGITESEILGSDGALQNVSRACLHLRRHGWMVRPSEVAISSLSSSLNSCKLSQQCIHGCPNNAIWFAGDQIRALRDDNKLDYYSGLTVKSLSPDHETVTVFSDRGTLKAKFVFIAAGPISTAAIMISSGFVERLDLKDSATVFGGVLSTASTSGQWTRHLLSQLWITSPDRKFKAQIYPASDEYGPRISSAIPQVMGASRFTSWLQHRTVPIIAYLDSSLSPILSVSRSSNGRVKVSSADQANADSRQGFQPYLRELALRLGMNMIFAPWGLYQFVVPGGGYHSGASLPHGRSSDIYGRPFGLKRIFVVDSSVLPEVQAGSITPTVMANSHRIGRVAPLL